MNVKSFRPVAIIGGTRTPFTKSFSHYARIPNKELMTATLQDLVKETDSVIEIVPRQGFSPLDVLNSQVPAEFVEALLCHVKIYADE